MDPQTDASLTTLLGGVELSAIHQDGITELVKVRQLPIRHMEKYLKCFDDEGKSIELFCDKPEGWADSLTAESHNQIIEKGQELNFPLFEGWYRRRMARAEILSPGLTAKLKELVGSIARNKETAPPPSPSNSSASSSPSEPASV